MWTIHRYSKRQETGTSFKSTMTFTPEFYFGPAFTILGLVFAALSFLARGQMKASSPELSAV
ncbi:MAG: hypothetical protein M1368_11440 [Thaumarchaeota archaeon]|nr:hypothetical protein [Nitrososphaerota archaeon]